MNGKIGKIDLTHEMKKPILNIASLLQDSQVNGPGNRDIIWVQGCAIRCPGCFNEHLWGFEAKYIIPVNELLEKFKGRVGLIEGISILGGEPLHQAYALSYLLEGIKEIGFSTVVYSGFTYEYLAQLNDIWVNKVLSNADILVDGAYQHDKQDKTLIWRGSTNQRILFLTNTYTFQDIPKAENYYHAETHVFDSENIELVSTGIR
jgi:anaerobic ribonucleoside-triphosphate reductase activating protein